MVVARAGNGVERGWNIPYHLSGVEQEAIIGGLGDS